MDCGRAAAVCLPRLPVGDASAPSDDAVSCARLITAYYDDSGSHGDTKSLVVCGFVSSDEQWLLFERDWNTVLRMPQFDLEHLHMRELRQGKGRFAKFQNNAALQRDLFERLHNVMRVRTQRTFAGSIMLDDYDRVNRDYLLQEIVGPPVVFAADTAIIKTMRWGKQQQRAPIQLVMDQGVSHFGQIDRLVYRRTQCRIVRRVVATTPPLQAADVAAWEIQRVLHGLAAGTVTRPEHVRGSFNALLTKLHINKDGEHTYDDSSWFVLDEPELRRVCETYPLPRREMRPARLTDNLHL